MANLRILVSSVVGYIVAALFNSILVIVKEEKHGVYEWLANTFSHHWIGQGILVILAFIVGTGISYAVYKGGEAKESLFTKLIAAVFIVTLISVGLIAGFFLLE